MLVFSFQDLLFHTGIPYRSHESHSSGHIRLALAKNTGGQSDAPQTVGNYYAQIRLGGKLIWKSLKTDTMSVAKLRLGDFHKQERQRADAPAAVSRGKMTFADALQTCRERLKGDHSLKQRSKNYREERITALLESWPDLKQTDVARISKTDCLTWTAESSNLNSFARLHANLHHFNHNLIGGLLNSFISSPGFR